MAEQLDMFGEPVQVPSPAPPAPKLPPVPVMDQELSMDLRDAGIEATEAKEEEERAAWMDEATAGLVEYAASHATFMAEQFRYWWLFTGNAAPHSEKVWGAVIMRAARRGLIVNTGVYRKASSAMSHAHALPLWKKAEEEK
jgi:hypothetical protein